MCKHIAISTELIISEVGCIILIITDNKKSHHIGSLRNTKLDYLHFTSSKVSVATVLSGLNFTDVLV